MSCSACGVKPGPLRIQETIGGPEQLLFVGGGFLEVLPDRVTVLADVVAILQGHRPAHPVPELRGLGLPVTTEGGAGLPQG